MGKTVIFGGTFNPIHRAHLLMISEIANLNTVDKILIIPDRIPPHKNVEADFPSGEERFLMCEAATRNIPKTECSKIELSGSGKSYTINTIKLLKEQNPNEEYALLIGGDMLASFDKWFSYRQILKEVSLLVVGRNTVDNDRFLNAIKKLKNEGADIITVDIKTPSVSSSEIRQKIRNGEDVSEYLTDEVVNFIKQNRLYRGGN